MEKEEDAEEEAEAEETEEAEGAEGAEGAGGGDATARRRAAIACMSRARAAGGRRGGRRG